MYWGARPAHVSLMVGPLLIYAHIYAYISLRVPSSVPPCGHPLAQALLRPLIALCGAWRFAPYQWRAIAVQNF